MANVDIAELGLRVDSSGFVRANRDLRDFENRAGRVERVAGFMGAAVARAGAQVGAMAAAFLSIRSALQATQQVAEITNGFRAMGQSSQQAAQSLEAVAGVANRTRAPLDATANLYRRISVAAGELGASQQGVLRFTENVGLALAAAGSGGAAASGALMQLSQAMAGGVVRAEEFNSILENAFPIAQAAARGIDEAGGSVGRLRQLVVEGEISSREFFDAIIGQTAELEAAFAKTVPTIDQALTLLNNNFTMLVGQFDQTLGVSSTLAQAIIALGNGMQWLSNNSELVFDVLGRLASVAAVLATVFVARTAVAIGTTYAQAAISAVRQTIALEMALGATSRSAAVASAGVKLFTAALRTMKSVLVSTGLGALVVLAGEAVFQFGRLVKATGSFGAALSALGNVAGLVWQGIIDSAAAIPPALNGVWSLMKAGFLGALADMADEFYQFINGIATSMGQIEAFKGISNSLLNVAVSAGEAASNLGSASREARSAADGAFAQAGATIADAFGPARAAVADLMQTVTAGEDSMSGAAGAAGDLADAVGGSGGGGKKGGKDSASEAAKKAAAEIKKLREEAQKLNDAADPVGKFTKQLAELEKLKEYGLNARGYNKAVQELNDELASSLPLVDDLTGAFSEFLQSGLSDFKSFAESVFGSFKKLIADMIATALRNRILIPIAAGVTGGSALGAVGQAALGAGGNPLGGLLGGGQGGGLLSGILGTAGGAGAAGSGFLGGLTGSLSGGIGGFFNIGANAAAAGGGFGAMLGAAAGPVGLALGVASLFKSTKEVVANGIAVIFENGEAELQQFEKSKRNNGLGMSSGFSRDYDRMDDAVQQTIRSRIQGVTDALDMFGMNSSLSGFSHESRNEIKDGETYESVLQEQIKTAMDNAIRYAVGEDAFSEFAKAGERVSETVERLSGSLLGVNGVLEDLGHRAYEVSLQGADMASQLADLFGGMEGFQQSTAFFFENFYSEAEQVEMATRKATEALAAHNAQMPQTREQYRAMVEGANLTTQSGRELYATLLGLGSVMNDILPAAEAVGTALSKAIDASLARVNSNLDTAISGNTAEARFQMQEARLWRRAADGLADVLNEMKGTPSALTNAQQAFNFNQSRFLELLNKARNGDIEAAEDLGVAAERLISSGTMVARTRVEQARLEAEVRNGLTSAEKVASSVSTRHEVIAGLLMDQVGVLNQIKTLVNSGLPIDPKQLAGLQGKLGSLETAIGREIQAMPPLVRNAILNGVDPLDDTFKTRVAQPMEDLRHSLGTLRGQIEQQMAADAAARREERERAAKIATLQSKLSDVAGKADYRSNRGQTLIDQIRDLEEKTGVDIRNGKGDAVLRVNPDGSISYAATHVAYGKGDDINAFRKAFWGDGGLQDKLNKTSNLQSSSASQVDKLREQIASLGGIPAFADGGMHMGGLRLVGERGPELEATGPARYYSASDTAAMMGGGMTAEELRALRAEVRGLREDNRALQSRIVENTGDSARIAKRQDREQRAAV